MGKRTGFPSRTSIHSIYRMARETNMMPGTIL